MAEETTQPTGTPQQATETTSSPAETVKPAAKREQPRSARSSSGQQRRRQQQPRGQRAPRRRRVCSFCVDKIDYIDYKKADLLSTYITPHGKIYSRRRTGTCAKHQRRLATAIKRARFLALLPYTADHIRLYAGGGKRES
ncbi:MAG TPA: 30S ribosomal protein S18 [Caldilineae bacterium]|nr:30S ribosomal protein S18 [Caldilineae bacterium]